MNTARRATATRWDGTPGDDYRFGMGGLRIGATPIAEVSVGSDAIAPPVRRTIPADFVLIPDPENEDERALIGAVILGLVSFDTVEPLIRALGHREIMSSLGQFNLMAKIPLPSLVTSCRAMGLPPEICGRVEVVDGKEFPLGYLAGCVLAAAALTEEQVVATMGRLRVTGTRR